MVKGSVSSSSYSWLCVVPEVAFGKSLPLSKWAKKKLSQESVAMQKTLTRFEKRVKTYTKLCKSYAAVAGTKKGDSLLVRMETLHEEIEHETKELNKVMGETFSLTHRRAA